MQRVYFVPIYFRLNHAVELATARYSLYLISWADVVKCPGHLGCVCLRPCNALMLFRSRFAGSGLPFSLILISVLPFVYDNWCVFVKHTRRAPDWWVSRTLTLSILAVVTAIVAAHSPTCNFTPPNGRGKKHREKSLFIQTMVFLHSVPNRDLQFALHYSVVSIVLQNPEKYSRTMYVCKNKCTEHRFRLNFQQFY